MDYRSVCTDLPGFEFGKRLSDFSSGVILGDFSFIASYNCISFLSFSAMSEFLSAY